MTTDSLHWLAGLLEGEGSFLVGKTSPLISVQMTDKDVVERVARCLGEHVQVRGPYQPKNPNAKQTYSASVYGETAIELMKRLRPMMGNRRQQQIDAVIAKRGEIKSRLYKGMAAKCHPDKPNKSRGLCDACYRHELVRNNPERYKAYGRKSYLKHRAKKALRSETLQEAA